MPWPFTGAARNELAQSHTAVCQLNVLRGGRKAYSLVPISGNGNVTADSDRSVPRNMSCTVTDPTGVLSGSDINDLLSPYNCEVQVLRGVQLPGTTGAVELAPLGVFVLTNRTVTGQGSVALTGQDRSIKYQGGMTASVSISANTPVEKAIAQLLLTRDKALQWKAWQVGLTVGPLVFDPETDVWKACQDLAAGAGGRLFHDRTGLLTFAPALPNNARPVARYAEKDGILLGVSRQEDADSIKNVVVVQQEAGSPIRAVVADLNPASPTYANGKYGYRVLTITNAHIATIAQAQEAARNELVRQLGRSETVTITIVPDPTLDPMEAITVHYPSADLHNTGLVTQTITYPLGVTESMQVVCRKFLLTEDGQQLDVPIEVTTS